MKNCVRSMVTATSILWRSNKTHSVMNAEGLAFRAEVSRQIWFLVFDFQRSGTSLTSTAPEPVTCFLHHIFTFVFGGGSFRKRGMTSGGKWFVLHPNNVIGSYVLNGGTSFESLEAKNYFWTGMYLFSRHNFRFISDSLVPSCWLRVRDFNKRLYWV